MTSWRERVVSHAEAVAAVRPGDTVFLGTGCGTPRRLVEALEERTPPPPGVTLVHFVANGAFRTVDGRAARYRHAVFMVDSETRGHVGAGSVDYVPIALPDAERLIRRGRLGIDVAMIQVAPPDEEGRLSLGISVDLTRSAALAARTVVAEVNPAMPRTRGDTTIPLDRVDHLVEVDDPVTEYRHPRVDAVASQIARYVARIIDDGSTLQIGLGRIPNEMLRYLENRRDLGIHSDVISDGIVDLIDRGVVTGRRKTIHRGRVVASYALGTRRLYDRVHDNPDFEFRPIGYVSDPAVVAANHRMVSVSQAFAVDLTGEVCADQFDGEFYGGVCAQPHFIRGATASPGGTAIICIASRTEDGSQSRIRPTLRSGEGVTVPRADVHYVVSEYGMAYLFGKGVKGRALALIGIAHPDDRPWLLEAAKDLGYLPPSQELRSRRAYPAEEERDLVAADGTPVLIRPTRAGDVAHMHDLFYELRPEDVYTRFFSKLRSLSDSMADHLCNVDYEHEMAFIALAGRREEGRPVATGCYYVDPSTNFADVAYIVHPEWQGRGLATAIQADMIDYARRQGVRGFTADVLVDNTAMLAVFRRSGLEVALRTDGTTWEITMPF